MNIIGISCFYHDASACLLRDGKIIAAAEEERFTRKKHDINFPINAINYCLKEGKISIKDVDYVAFYEKPILKFERILNQHLEGFPRSFWSFYKTIPNWFIERLRIPSLLKKRFNYKGKIFFIDHHLAHAASSYLVSPFNEAAILTIDGVGEWQTTTLGYGNKNNIELIKELNFPHSIGLLYSAVTAYLGFKVNNDEYKVMGLAPYGKPIYYDNFKKVIQINEDGSYKLDMSYFVYHYKLSMPSNKFIKEFGSIRKRGEEINQRHKDIASSLQKITEEIIYKILNKLYEETKCKNLCVAGGVALNSVANGKICNNTPFEDIYILPAAGDGGTSVGAATYLYYNLLNPNKKREHIIDCAYLGPNFSNEETKTFLDQNNINYSIFKDENDLIKKVAKLIYKNNVIGWFHGRMEFGPRALGCRSILSNPCNPDMKDILNLKVKHREHFRPFAPVICLEDARKYFICDKKIHIPADFMLMVYPIKKNKQKLIPAVTHIDGSGRLQIIRREHNHLYYDLIKEFEKLSGVPILINTSYNIRGEPIVCTPHDAYKCMMGTGIDYLVIDKFLIAREDNPKDMWDSEKYAKD